MKNLKTLSIIAIVSLGLFATSCTPENLDNDQTEQQVKHKNNRPAANG
jgi:hydrogenase maturation factor HypF (carbamoyltransferase family)